MFGLGQFHLTESESGYHVELAGANAAFVERHAAHGHVVFVHQVRQVDTERLLGLVLELLGHPLVEF